MSQHTATDVFRPSAILITKHAKGIYIWTDGPTSLVLLLKCTFNKNIYIWQSI